MKKLILICLLIPIISNAQDESGWKLYSAGASTSFSHLWVLRNDPDIGSILKNPSAIEDLETNNFYWGYPPYIVSNSSTNYSLNTGFVRTGKNQVVNFNVCYSLYSEIPRGSITDYNNEIVDTMTVTHSTGQQEVWLLDSMTYTHDMFYRKLQIASAGMDYVFRTKRRMITAYGGGGLQLGFSTVSTASHSSARMQSYGYKDTNGYEIQPYYVAPHQVAYGGAYYPADVISSEFQVLDVKTMFIVSPFLPFGFEITPFIERNWLSRIALDVNGKVGAEMRFMNGADPYVRPYYSFGAGLKYFFE